MIQMKMISGNKRRPESSMTGITPDDMMEQEYCVLQFKAKVNGKGSSVRSMLLDLMEGFLI